VSVVEERKRKTATIKKFVIYREKIGNGARIAVLPKGKLDHQFMFLIAFNQMSFYVALLLLLEM
jgi:hypothetical protein